MGGNDSNQEPLLPLSGLHTQSAFLGTDRSSSPLPVGDVSTMPAHIVSALGPLTGEDQCIRRMIVDPKEPLKLKVVKKGWKMDWKIYTQSPFHTLLHMPALRFSIIFFLAYILFFASFAVVYLAVRDDCVVGIRRFSHAFYFSVQTSSTIGYGGDLTPNPDCLWVNLMVTIQTILSLMLDYSMLGIVYARFSSPTLRAWSIRFSKSLFMHMVDDHLLLSMRVGNVRSKTILNPSAKIVLAMEVDCKEQEASEADGKPLCLVDLKAKMSSEAEACLSLGLPATISHVIDEHSPLANLSIQTMASRHMEIVALLGATDAMTSDTVEARHSYQASDIVLNGQPAGVRRRDDGQLVVDYTCFCERTSGDLTLDDAKATFETQSPANFLDSPAVARSMIARHAAGGTEEQLPPCEDLGMPDDDACPAGARSRSSVDISTSRPVPSPRPGSSPEACTLAESAVSAGSFRDEALLNMDRDSQRSNTEIAMDFDHTALPPVSTSSDAPSRRRSIASLSFRADSFAKIRQHLVSNTTPPGRRLVPSPRLFSPRRSSSAWQQPTEGSQGQPSTLDTAWTAPYSMGGHNLVAVPEEGSPEWNSFRLAAESRKQQHKKQLLELRVQQLCGAIIADKGADQLVKEKAVLLRCELNENEEE